MTVAVPEMIIPAFWGWLMCGAGLLILLVTALSNLWPTRAQEPTRRDPIDAARDEAVAERTEHLAREMLDEHASLQRIKSERHWNTSMGDDLHDSWTANRIADAQGCEQAAKRFHSRLAVILAEAQRRAIKVHAWGVDGWDDHALSAWGRALLLLAASLRAGDYADKVLMVYRHDQALDTQDAIRERLGPTSSGTGQVVSQTHSGVGDNKVSL